MRDKVRAVGRWFADLPGGRRTKFAVLGVWLVDPGRDRPAGGQVRGRPGERPGRLPAGQGGVGEGDQRARGASRPGDISDAITVFNRDGGLDRRRPRRDRPHAGDDQRRPPRGRRRDRPADPLRGRQRGLARSPRSRSRTAATRPATCSSTRPTTSRPASTELPAGLEAKVTGPAGFSADAIDVFDSINGTLLYATAALVLVLLIIIYRSPIFWLIPFFSVILAEVDLARARLSARRGRRDRHRAVGRHPAGARLRRRHRLRAAARLALPRGAAPPRGQARCDPRGDAHGRPGDRRLGRDGDGRAADASRWPRSTARPGSARSARSASASRWSRC